MKTFLFVLVLAVIGAFAFYAVHTTVVAPAAQRQVNAVKTVSHIKEQLGQSLQTPDSYINDEFSLNFEESSLPKAKKNNTVSFSNTNTKPKQRAKEERPADEIVIDIDYSHKVSSDPVRKFLGDFYDGSGKVSYSGVQSSGNCKQVVETSNVPVRLSCGKVVYPQRIIKKCPSSR